MFRRVLAIALAVAVVILLVVAITTRPRIGLPAIANPESPGPFSFAVIGDIPYGEAQLTQFPRLAQQINADSEVGLVVHLGDIKDSATPCTDAYFKRIRSEFERFDIPVLYTPGDNEWTDCHKPANGSFNPLERLAKLREVFFNTPNTQLAAQTSDYFSYAGDGYPENVRFSLKGVSFGATHVVGAANGSMPWTGRTDANPEQAAAVKARTDAAVRVIHDTFDEAAKRGDKAVVFMMQADMFPPNEDVQTPQMRRAFKPIVAALAERSSKSPLPVYVFNGDSHVYRADEPLMASTMWPKFYGVAPTDKLHRVTVDGDVFAKDYLRVRVDSRQADPLTWERIPRTK